MTGTRRRIAAMGTTPRLFVFFAIIAIFITLLAWIDRVSPSAAMESEADGAVGIDALRRGRLLLQQLAPGEAATALKVTYSYAAGPHRPSRPREIEEVIVASAEPESVGRFVATYNTDTAQLCRLTWASLTPPREPAPRRQFAGERELLDYRRAVLVAHRCLRVAGVAEAGSPWAERSVRRVPTKTPEGVRFQWKVQLLSPRWLFRIAIDSLTGVPVQILLLPRNGSDARPRGAAP